MRRFVFSPTISFLWSNTSFHTSLFRPDMNHRPSLLTTQLDQPCRNKLINYHIFFLYFFHSVVSTWLESFWQINCFSASEHFSGQPLFQALLCIRHFFFLVSLEHGDVDYKNNIFHDFLSFRRYSRFPGMKSSSREKTIHFIFRSSWSLILAKYGHFQRHSLTSSSKLS